MTMINRTVKDNTLTDIVPKRASGLNSEMPFYMDKHMAIFLFHYSSNEE